MQGSGILVRAMDEETSSAPREFMLQRNISAVLSLIVWRISALSEQQYVFDMLGDSECPSADAAPLNGEKLQRMPVALLDSHVQTYLCLLDIWAGET